MNILASVGRGLGSWLGLPSRNSLGLSAASASLPVGEVQLSGSRPVTLVAAPAQPASPVATGGPGQLVRGNPPDLEQTITAMSTLRKASPAVRAQAMAARPGTRPAPRAKAAPPALDADGVAVEVEKPADDPENPPGVDQIISQLLDLVLELKKQVQVTADDDAETQAALGLFAAGKKLSASSALMAVTKKMCQRPRLTPAARIARGYNAQDGVRAIQAALRPGPRTAPTVPTGTIAASASAVSADVSPSDRLAKIAALRAERETLETAMRKSYVFDAKSVARQQQIRAELHRLKAR